jgi:hypothetical protein
MKHLVLVLGLLSPAVAAAAQIEDANKAYFAYDVGKAEALYRQIAVDPSATAEDRGKAEVGLAHVEWLVDGDSATAVRRLKHSLRADPQPCAGALLYARILNGSGRASEVPRLINSYMKSCSVLEPRVGLEVVRSRVSTSGLLPFSNRRSSLQAARASIVALPPMTAMNLAAARASMDIGLLSGDGEEALRGWRSYLWLADGNQPQGFPIADHAIAAIFRRGARVGAAKHEVESLAELLVRAGLAEEVEQLVRDHHVEASDDLGWRKINAYLKMRQTLRSKILIHDRAYARSRQENADEFEKTLLAMLRDGARAGGASVGDDPWPALESLWGIHGQTGEINGVSGLMLGHAVEDRRQTIQQGSRRGQIRFIVLDNMIENSFSAWLWDTGGGPGGWAKAGEIIYQIRAGYAREALRVLSETVRGAARDKAMLNMKTLAEADPAQLTKDGPGSLPGVASRLEFQAAEMIAAQVRSRNTDMIGFMKIFSRAWWDAQIESSIILHEGRHILDQAEYKGPQALSEAELEFRAKLSEIGYTETPRIALSYILQIGLPAGTSHGDANRRIVSLYVAWIKQNREKIAGLDNSQPPALEIDKLTDAQLRQVVLEADPELTRANPLS